MIQYELEEHGRIVRFLPAKVKGNLGHKKKAAHSRGPFC
jgi:hypothetical protein